VKITRTVAPGAHAVPLLDQAVWHRSAKPEIPTNVIMMPLLPKPAGLNPVDRFWRFLRDDRPSNRVLVSGRHHRSLLPCLENRRVEQSWATCPWVCVRDAWVLATETRHQGLYLTESTKII
jgi:hypothetical protein